MGRNEPVGPARRRYLGELGYDDAAIARLRDGGVEAIGVANRPNVQPAAMSDSWTTSAVIGTACDLVLTFGAVVVVSCVSSLTGDCTDDVPPTGSSTGPGGFGGPSSVSGGHVTWTFHYASNAGAQVVYDLIVSVSSSAP